MTTNKERQDYLRNCIAQYYDSNQCAFTRAFNQMFEEKMLDNTTVSRQLSGQIRISNAWYVSYMMFFLH